MNRVVDVMKLYNKKYRQTAEGILVCDADASFEHLHCWNYLKDFDKWETEEKFAKRSNANKKRPAPQEVTSIPGDVLETVDRSNDPVI